MIIAAVRSVATFLAISLYVLVTAPIGIALALGFRWKNLLYWLGHGGVKLALASSGIRFRVEGREHLPLGRAAVYCSNHQSNVDPPVLFDALHPRMHVLYKQEIDAIPLLARAFRLGGFIAVDRRNREAAMRAIERGAQSIRSGNSFLIFPEGKLTVIGPTEPSKSGIGLLAVETGASVLPTRIDVLRAGFYEGKWLPQARARVRVSIGQPVRVPFGTDYAKATAILEQAVRDA